VGRVWQTVLSQSAWTLSAEWFAFQDAVACYERMAQDERKGPDFYKGMVQCYLGLDQPITALRIAQGIVSERYEKFLWCESLDCRGSEYGAVVL
jgi:hypothetical protein